MNHSEVEQHEMVDGYVRNRLSDDERQAFEEHFFTCDQCFEQVQTAQRFADGIRHAAETGLLPAPAPAVDHGFFATWWRPAFLFTGAAAAGLLLTTGWYGLREVPRLRLEAAMQQARVRVEQDRAAALQSRLEANLMAMNRPPEAQANLPLVMLEASRADGVSSLAIPAAAPQAALWIEVPPTDGFTSYKLEVVDSTGRVVEAVGGLTKNSYGALAASMPSAKLASGFYRARLFGVRDGKQSLAGEYKLSVKK